MEQASSLEPSCAVFDKASEDGTREKITTVDVADACGDASRTARAVYALACLNLDPIEGDLLGSLLYVVGEAVQASAERAVSLATAYHDENSEWPE